jgi:hypothetical protein
MAPLWLQELEMDPAKPAVAMSTRALGDRPWLIADENAATELSQKQRLCAERHDEVFAASQQAVEASAEVAALIRGTGVAVLDDPSLHPLEAAGRSVQEDLCLMERRPDGWYLSAASLCFPSRWRLSDKINQHITQVHAPVAGYALHLADRVDQLFDRLRQPVWRRNWFVHANPALFQPTRPTEDPLVPAEQCKTGLVLRSERQVLSSLETPGWTLFSIKTQQVRLGEVFDDPAARRSFETYLRNAQPSNVARRGIALDQRDQILLCIEPSSPLLAIGCHHGQVQLTENAVLAEFLRYAIPLD